jgi:dienelactone hydrolase
MAVMGFSKGLCGALCQLGSLRRTHGPVDVESAAYIPFYPSCCTKYIDDDQVSDRPIRLFHGTAGDYVCIEPCRNYVERLHRAAKDVQLTEYVGARYAFDNPLHTKPLSLPSAVITKHTLEGSVQKGKSLI